ncbi:hypothetical protein J6590_037365 [Homalodisca vitripennis]|nr:hypothetical protein J6590_037365 [Homalodisca vitripennis]
MPVYHHGYHHGRVFPEQCSRIAEDERKVPDEEKSVRFERELTFVSAVNFILNYVIGEYGFLSNMYIY